MRSDLPTRGEWHLLTSEYPPIPGGVSDYSLLVARALGGAGDPVHVWCPPAEGVTPAADGVAVHRILTGMGRGELRALGERLDAHAAPRRLFVQWVPQGFGFHAMNVGFCLWLWGRARKGDQLHLMVHEPYVEFDGSATQRVVAAIHRVMTSILIRAAHRVWVSIPAWTELWRPYAWGRRVPFGWLPVPSGIEVVEDRAGVAERRARYAGPRERLVGNFGTFGPFVRPLLLAYAVELLARDARVRLLLIGRDSPAAAEELVAREPSLRGRVHATGELAPDEVSRHLQACDLVVQPYADGVSSRRTTVMAALAHGVPVVTMAGRFTEREVWTEGAPVALATPGESPSVVDLAVRALGDDSLRERLGEAGRALYERRFAVKHTVAALRANSHR